MVARLRTTNRRKTPVATCLLLLFLVAPPRSLAHDEWYRGLDLESALTDSGLVLVGRVIDVSETKLGVGGKGERSLLQYKFEPVLVLKGVFSRESLLLTSDDLGTQQFTDAAPIEPGQLRLLVLGRSSAGYAMRREARSLDQAIPPLRDPNDELLATVKVLLAVNHSSDRAKKVALLLDGLRKQKGAPAIPLLVAVERRSLLAAQTSGAVEGIAPHLSDPSPAVRGLKVHGQSGAVLTLLKQVPLDAPPEIQYGAEWAAGRLDPSEGVKEVTLRIRKKYDAGLPVVTEINLLGDLPPAEAAPALVDAAKLTLNHDERQAFVSACRKVANARLVATLATMLVPTQQDIWWY